MLVGEIMKTKRSLLSMIVFLFIFIMTGILDIKDPSFVTRGKHSQKKETPITANEESADNFSISFSSLNTNTEISSLGNYYYLIPREAEEYQTEFRTMTTTENDNPDEEANIQENITEETSEDTINQEDEDMTSLEDSDTEEAKYADIGISIANSFVNIRENPDQDSPSLGKLYRNAAARVLDAVDDWYLVESGSVKGYLKAEYLKTGISDEELIKNYGTMRIRVKVDGLNVREETNTEAKKLTVIYKNETYPVLELLDEWVKIDIKEDNTSGYVAREHVELNVEFIKAVSKEEEQELERLKAAEKAKKEVEVKYSGGVSYSADELKLLACLVHAESGNQSYEGKLAVANVVLNRVKSGKYPNSIKSVIYQKGQFTVASSGSLAKQLAKYENYSTQSQLLTIKAAKAALSGANNIGSRLYFNGYKSAARKGYNKKPNSVKLEDHLFW